MAIKNHKRVIAMAAACLVVMVNPGSAEATLISASSSFGADTITLDTDTGLRWLDVTLSTAYSYDDILLELGSAGVFSGYRLATRDDVLGMWGNAGIDLGPGFLNTFTSANYQPVVDLMAFVGVTGPNLGNLGGGNFFDYAAGHIESGPGGGGSVTVATLSADPDPTVTGRAGFGVVPSGSQNRTHGAWLVSAAIPEPSAAIVFAVGSVIVGLSARRRIS